MLLIPDLRVKAQQYILFSHYFFVGKRRRHKIFCYPWVKLNHPSRNRAQYSRVFPSPPHPFFSFIIALYSPINYLLPWIVYVLPYTPYSSTYLLYSLVSFLRSHISPYPAIYTLYSLVPSLFSHISPYPSSYPLYSLASSLYSYISPYPSTYPLYSLVHT